MLRLVFHLALRQAESFATSVLRLRGQALRVPDHTTLSRCSHRFAGRQPKAVPHGPLHLLIDSTGLKLFGQGEWDEEKHRRTRQSWRKLHLAVDASTGEFVTCLLTDNAADDASQLPALLEPIEGEIASVTADGAYGAQSVYQAIAIHQPNPPPAVIIPPRASAVPSTDNADAPTQRDRHIRLIAEKGRRAWQRATGYGRRSLAETAVGRHKTIIGPKLRARLLPSQQSEVAMAAQVLNRMIQVAKPVSTRAA